MLINYSRAFLLEGQQPAHQYWEEEPKVFQKQLFDDTESIIISTHLGGSHLGGAQHLESGYLSFQNYFHTNTNKSDSDVDSINHQLTMLRSDYNLLKMSPVKYKPPSRNNNHQEVQMSNQSIQNFKEPTAHQKKNPQPLDHHHQNYNILPLQSLLPSSPQLKDRQRSQIEELTLIQ